MADVRDVRVTVGDFASPPRGEQTNPCVTGNAHLFLGSLFVLGEGRGGADGGRLESRLAVSAVLANFRESTVGDATRRLCEALEHGNQVLFTRSQTAAVFQQAWAATAAVLIRRGRVYAARVGDVRLVLLRDGEARWLLGPPNPASPLLGQAEVISADVPTDETALRSGDRLLVANGSLFEALPHEEIVRLVTTLVPTVAARRIVETVDREPSSRFVSVQIVQIGEAFGLDDGPTLPMGPGTPAELSPLGALPPPTPVHAVPSAQRPPTVPLPLRERPTGLDLTALGEGGQSKARWVPIGVIGLMLVVLVVWKLRSGPKASEEPAQAPSTPAFWDWVGGEVKHGGTLDKNRVRAHVASDQELAMRLAEARALIAAFEPQALPRPPESEDPAGREAPTEPPKSDTPPPEVAPTPPEPPTPPVPADPNAWDPSKLPTNLRGFENIFAMADKKAAAKKLRAFIHSRHANIDLVLKLLDGYLQVAPRDRSLAVMELLPATKPGPKTKTWAEDMIRRLKAGATPPAGE